MKPDPRRDDLRARLAIGGVIAAGVLVRLLAVRAQGFPTDVATFQAWAERVAQLGPGRFYEPGYFSDYPPGFLYVLGLLGALFDGELLRLAVKAISIPADVGIAALAAAVVWRYAGRTPAIAATALWMFAPGQVFAGPYWGQVDAVGTLPLLGAIVAAGSRRWWIAGLLAALAALVKPQFGIGLFIVTAAATFEFVRDARWRPVVQVLGVSAATTYALCVPFWGPSPARIASELVGLVRSAAETYPYTSLYAFNGWSIFFDFWKPDDGLVATGAVMLAAGLLASTVPLWWRRDLATLLACAACAALAFYFLPTRAHERYLFPFFALALPFAATRGRILAPYLTCAIAFALTLYFAFTRYEQFVDLRVPQMIESTLFGRAGQIALAALLMGAAAYLVWRLVRGDARLRSDHTWRLPVPSGVSRWELPAGLGPGRVPSRRDIGVALLVALLVLVTRGYRLDWPRDMYFDEVYHARTAFELLAQREPYEWTHPHLAKEIMALGILAFGQDRVIGNEAAPSSPVAFAVDTDGTRAFATADRRLVVRERDGPERVFGPVPEDVRALALDGGRLVVLTDTRWLEYALGDNTPVSHQPATGGRAVGLALAGGRLAVATSSGVAIYPDATASPVIHRGTIAAITAKSDGSVIYALDPSGTVHAIDGANGEPLKTFPGPAGSSLVYVQNPESIFVGDAASAAVDVIDLESGSRERIPLANGRTGTLAAPVSALAAIPRTHFVYALSGDRVVVIEPHGGSPYTSIPVTGMLLGVDGEDDKLLVAGPNTTQLIETGRHAFAWRLPGVLFGAILAFVLVLFARRLFAAALVPVFVGIAAVACGAMFAQARIGMNDIYVATLIFAGWYFVVAAHRPRRSAILDLIIAGVLFGLAAAAKWVAFYALAAMFVAAVAVTARAYERGRPGSGGPLDLLGRRGLNAGVLFVSFAVAPVAIYLASYLSWFGGPTIPYGWDMRELTQQMYWYHSSLTAPHPAGSPWWSWPLVLKPVYWYFGQSTAVENAYIYNAGNVVLFWGGLVAFVWCAVAAIRARSVALGLVVFAGLAQYVPWIPISRVLFFYHFFTALPFYLLALAAGLAYLWETARARWVVAYLAAAAAIFVYFYPFISGQPFPGAQAGMFFILPTWTYDCQFYPTFVCAPAISSAFSADGLFLRLGIALAVTAAVALLIVASRSPALMRLLPTARQPKR